jgi:hypothetical protein
MKAGTMEMAEKLTRQEYCGIIKPLKPFIMDVMFMFSTRKQSWLENSSHN